MNIVNWNVLGAGREGFLSQVMFMILKYNLDIIALVETRVNSHRAYKIIEKINFQNHLEIPLEGFSGGI